jgi:hypothetical protein
MCTMLQIEWNMKEVEEVEEEVKELKHRSFLNYIHFYKLNISLYYRFGNLGKYLYISYNLLK